jgi:uncharacterized protein (TIGR03067 family)
MNPVLVALALTAAAPGPKDPPKKDPPTIVGEWVIESVSAADGAPPVQPPAATTVYTADGKFEYRTSKGTPYQSGTYTADPKKKPAEIDLTSGAKLGIYKIDGDTHTIGLDGNPKVRPKSFGDGPGAAMYLFVYKRAKKD